MLPHITIIGVSIHTFNLMIFLGIVVAYIVVIMRTDKFDISFSHFLILCAFAITGMLIGSKLLYFATIIHTVITNFSFSRMIITFLNGGFVFYGGLFGTLLGLAVATRILRKDTKMVIRFFILSVPIFHFFGRIGCFLAGCCYGKELGTLLFNVVYLEKIPVQLIEAIFELILFIILLHIDRKYKKTDTLRIYMVSYALFRFTIEFFRGDKIRGIFIGISTAQWIAIAIIIYYIVQLLRKKFINIFIKQGKFSIF